MFAFKACSSKLAHEVKTSDTTDIGFELLGFDFMVTDNLEVLLIEINQNPCLSALSDNQGTLITKLVDDTLKYPRPHLGSLLILSSGSGETSRKAKWMVARLILS